MIIRRVHRRAVAAVFIALALPLIQGCQTTKDVARIRAGNDLHCPEEQVALENIGGLSYRATGCGGEATYTCVRNGDAISCVREALHPELVRATPQVAPPAADAPASNPPAVAP